jgi:hypothetical protein
LSDHPLNAEIDAFYLKTVVEADTSFRQFFNVKSAFIQNIARNLRNAYTNYQETVKRFPLDSLSAANRESFGYFNHSVDSKLQSGVDVAEGRALDFVWSSNLNTGIRGPKTPSEEHLEYSLRTHLNFLQENVRSADETCLAVIASLIVPSYQPYADAIVKAASDQIPNINEENFKMSLESAAESVQLTNELISVLDNCAKSSSTDECIGNFVSRIIAAVEIFLQFSFHSARQLRLVQRLPLHRPLHWSLLLHRHGFFKHCPILSECFARS